MDTNIKDKNDVLQRIDAVCKTLDAGIAVSGAQNAGNLAACFTILQETLAFLVKCNITPPSQKDEEKP